MGLILQQDIAVIENRIPIYQWAVISVIHLLQDAILGKAEVKVQNGAWKLDSVGKQFTPFFFCKPVIPAKLGYRPVCQSICGFAKILPVVRKGAKKRSTFFKLLVTAVISKAVVNYHSLIHSEFYQFIENCIILINCQNWKMTSK